MGLVIREVQLVEVKSVAEFLSYQFQKEFQVLHLKQNKIIELLIQSMKYEQCFIALLDEQLIGVIAYSTVDNSSFEVSFKEVKNILGLVKAIFFYWTMMKSNLLLKPNQIYINALAVNPLFRSQGVATSLIQFVMNKILVQEYLLEVLEDNITAINLYQKLGFENFQQRRLPYLLEIKRKKKNLMRYISN